MTAARTSPIDDAVALLRQLDRLEAHLGTLRADLEARLAGELTAHTLAARAARLRAAVVDLAATVAVQAAVLGPAHAASLLNAARERAGFAARWWLGWAGVGPYRSDAAAWWLRGGPAGERLRDRRARRC